MYVIYILGKKIKMEQKGRVCPTIGAISVKNYEAVKTASSLARSQMDFNPVSTKCSCGTHFMFKVCPRCKGK